jgi:16S rRNA (guanine966-N2)-methyltransferase
MTRIIAGKAGGRRLQVPASGTRPTTDRVRESMFSRIDARFLANDQHWSQMRVLDLCAGSGALSLEAWSRGASFVQCVERDRRAFRTLQTNIAELGAHDVHATCADVNRFEPIGVFDICFFDPPYDWSNDDVQAVLHKLGEQHALTQGCLVVVERSRSGECPFADPVVLDDERRYGDTILWYGQVVDLKGR